MADTTMTANAPEVSKNAMNVMISSDPPSPRFRFVVKTRMRAARFANHEMAWIITASKRWVFRFGGGFFFLENKVWRVTTDHERLIDPYVRGVIILIRLEEQLEDGNNDKTQQQHQLIQSPASHDVIVMKNRNSSALIGNCAFLELVSSVMDWYGKCDTEEERRDVVEFLRCEVQDRKKGRFLKPKKTIKENACSFLWVAADEKTINQYIKDLLKKQRVSNRRAAAANVASIANSVEWIETLVDGLPSQEELPKRITSGQKPTQGETGTTNPALGVACKPKNNPQQKNQVMTPTMMPPTQLTAPAMMPPTQRPVPAMIPPTKLPAPSNGAPMTTPNNGESSLAVKFSTPNPFQTRKPEPHTTNNQQQQQPKQPPQPSEKLPRIDDKLRASFRSVVQQQQPQRLPIPYNHPHLIQFPPSNGQQRPVHHGPPPVFNMRMVPIQPRPPPPPHPEQQQQQRTNAANKVQHAQGGSSPNDANNQCMDGTPQPQVSPSLLRSWEVASPRDIVFINGRQKVLIVNEGSDFFKMFLFEWAHSFATHHSKTTFETRKNKLAERFLFCLHKSQRRVIRRDMVKHVDVILSDEDACQLLVECLRVAFLRASSHPRRQSQKRTQDGDILSRRKLAVEVARYVQAIQDTTDNPATTQDSSQQEQNTNSSSNQRPSSSQHAAAVLPPPAIETPAPQWTQNNNDSASSGGSEASPPAAAEASAPQGKQNDSQFRSNNQSFSGGQSALPPAMQAFQEAMKNNGQCSSSGRISLALSIPTRPGIRNENQCSGNGQSSAALSEAEAAAPRGMRNDERNSEALLPVAEAPLSHGTWEFFPLSAPGLESSSVVTSEWKLRLEPLNGQGSPLILDPTTMSLQLAPSLHANRNAGVEVDS